MAHDAFKDDILNNALSQRQQERRAQRTVQREKKNLEIERGKRIAENRKKVIKVLVLVVAILALVAALTIKSYLRIQELREQKELAQRRLEELQIKIQKLNDEYDRVSSSEYIEQQARAQLRMIYPGERLYIVLDRNK